MRIALLVDNPFRDLRGLVLLANYLRRKGQEVFLVPMNQRGVELWALAPDYVLFNYMRNNNDRFIVRLIEAGVDVGILDNEGGVIVGFDLYEKVMAPDPDHRAAITHYFCWGPLFSTELERRGCFTAEQLLVTGHPRFDFYTSPWNTQAMKQFAARHAEPPIIVIPANFSLANPGFQTPEKELQIYVRQFGLSEADVADRQDTQRRAMEAFAALINRLAEKLPHVTFVYRPHPFERVETYHDLLDDRDNIHLSKTGTVDALIPRAMATLHIGCSTAIEATVVGVPTLIPTFINQHPETILKRVEEVCIPCEDEASLIDYLKQAAAGKLEIPEQQMNGLKQIIKEHFLRFDGLAHQRVGDIIIEHAENRKRRINKSLFRKMAYHYGRNLKPKASSALTIFRKLFRLPIDWAPSRRRPVPIGGIRWDNTDKFFSQEAVLRELAMIDENFKALDVENEVSIGIAAAVDTGDYLTQCLEGRTLVLTQQNESER